MVSHGSCIGQHDSLHCHKMRSVFDPQMVNVKHLPDYYTTYASFGTSFIAIDEIGLGMVIFYGSLLGKVDYATKGFLSRCLKNVLDQRWESNFTHDPVEKRQHRNIRRTGVKI